MFSLRRRPHRLDSGPPTLRAISGGNETVYDYDRYHRVAVGSAPTGWRRASLIGVTAAVLMTLGLLVAEATVDGAHATTVSEQQAP
jgi:hypothetical protein